MPGFMLGPAIGGLLAALGATEKASELVRDLPFAARTTVSPTLIAQTYAFNRQMHLGELASAKFIYIPFLTWLIAPRIFIRSASGKFTAIYGATPQLHAAFGQIHRIVNRGY